MVVGSQQNARKIINELDGRQFKGQSIIVKQSDLMASEIIVSREEPS